ncbi:MAG TPA: TonB-dependent receptor, partial [Bryobacteraceae bacterium]|nr:TonB-dependent receptor [Bryobacteraceae bacterium]
MNGKHFFALAALLAAAPVSAQVTTATIYGRVLDPSGAGIPQAKVTLLNEGTNTSSSATSDETGDFTVPFLPVGRYSISIEANGFRGQKRTGIELGAGQRVGAEYRLELGNVAEVVEITSSTPLVNTVSAEQREAKVEVQVRELPLSRRDWTNMIGLGTGVTNQGNGVSMNGLPGSGFRLTVDGTDAEGDPEAPSLGMSGNFNPIKTVSMEAISEFAVTKGIPSAEVANTMSGGINIITKSGTNAFHGSLFLNNQVEDFAARPQFATTKGALVYNQFGASLGGRIIRDKLFFFGVYEGYRQVRAQTISGNVPTAEFRERAIAAVPAYRPFFDLFPLPTAASSPGAINAFFVTNAANPGKDNHGVTRVDYHVRDNLIMSARYTRGRPNVTNPRVAAANPQTFNGLTESGSLSLIYSRPTWTNESRFGVNHNVVARVDGIYALGLAGISGNLGFSTGGETLGRSGETISWENVTAKTFGRHNIKAGAISLTRRIRRENIESPDLQYTNEADFLANIPSRIQVTFGVLPFQMTQWQLGGFIQDDFRVSRRLTLNLGIRYDYFSVPKERDDRLFNLADFGRGPLLPSDSIYKADFNNFSPRVGFAYILDDDGKTVLRGGIGTFVNPRNMFGGPVDLVQNAIDEPFRRVFSRADALQFDVLRYPVVNANVLPLVKGATLAPASVLSEDYVNPYSIQMQFGIQRQLTDTLVLETGYVGTRGIKLNMVRDLNQVDRVTGVRPNPSLGTYRAYDGSDRSRYESLQTSLRKRLSNSLLFNLHHTWANQLTFSDGDLLLNSQRPQDNNNLRAERGPGPTDVRHRFAADFLYELPFAGPGTSNAFQRLAFGGWQISGIYIAQTGTPFSISNPSSIPGQRLDYVGGDVYLDNSQADLFYLNRAAFREVPQIT